MTEFEKAIAAVFVVVGTMSIWIVGWLLHTDIMEVWHQVIQLREGIANMDKALAEAALELAADNLYDIIKENYNKVNHEYLQKQVDIASEYLSEEQKEDLRGKGFVI